MRSDKTQGHHMAGILLLLGLAASLLSVNVQAEPSDGVPLTVLTPRPRARWLEHVNLGARTAYLFLDDDIRTPQDTNRDGEITANEVLAVSYMGSINQLEVDQWIIPSRLYAQIEFSRYCGLELGWEDYEVRTSTYWDGHSDGAFSLAGPLLGIYAKYANRTRFSPYVQAGVVWFGVNFSPDLRWTVMMDEETFQNWLAAGAPETWFDGVRQHLDTGDAIGTLLMAGCEVYLTESFSLEVFVRAIDVDVYGHWYNTRLFFEDGNPAGERRLSQENGTYRFPMSTTAFGLGIQYSF